MRLLDLYCGAGGAAKGYADAGFQEIDGVDNEPQPHYPYRFILGDALEYLAAHGREYDAIHASPPCQGYSIMTLNLPWHRDRKYPLLILPTIRLLEQVGRPYVLENVMGARHGSKSIEKRGLEEHGLQAGWLCGMMFGLPFYRHRLFAANWLWLAPGHPKHEGRVSTGPSPQRRGGGVSEQIVSNLAPSAASGRGIPPKDRHPNPVNTRWREMHDGTGLNIREGYETNSLNFPTISDYRPGGRLKDKKISLSTGKGTERQGWKLAAEVMGIDWMNRGELTQAIPPVFTEHIGRQLIPLLQRGQG